MLVLSVTAPEENGGVDLTGYRVEYKEILVNEFAIGTLIEYICLWKNFKSLPALIVITNNPK